MAANFKTYAELQKFVEENEYELREYYGDTMYKKLYNYSAIKATSASYGNKFASSSISQLDNLAANSKNMDKSEFNFYWNQYEDAAIKELTYADKATKSGATALSPDVLGQYEALSAFSYDDTDDEDMWRQQYGIAPKSLDSSLKRAQKSGYDATQFWTANKDGTATEQAMYLETKYQYDTSDPDDVLNYLYGRTPKSFKYDNTDEDVARKMRGQLPAEAEQYVNNSKQFATEYAEYEEKMQQYADELYQWENGPATGFLGIFKSEKPKNPYPDGAPETIQALQQYKNLIAETKLETPTAYDKFTKDEKTVEAPGFFFGDIENLPLYVDEKGEREGDASYFQPSEDVLARSQYEREVTNTDEYKFAQAVGLNVMANKVVSQYADTKMEQRYIGQLKEAGIYDQMQKENANNEAAMRGLLSQGYSADNYKTLLDNADLAKLLNVEDGKAELNSVTISALQNKPVRSLTAAGNSFMPTLEDIYAQTSDTWLNSDDEISGIRDQLKTLGWNGESKSDNGAIQTLIEKAEYRVMQLREQTTQMYKDALKDMPSWVIAIGSGMSNGVNSVAENVQTVALELAKAGAQNTAVRSAVGDVIKDNVNRSQARQEMQLENIKEARGGLGIGQNIAYNVASTATELGLEIAMGNVLGSLGAGAAATESIAAASKLGKVAKTLLFSKELIPYFVASLGSNLAEGELEGRTDLENWTVSLATAYMEAKTESMFGFFSNSGSAYKIFKNGPKGLSKETLKNFGTTLLENTLGETFEEVVQDALGSVIKKTFAGEETNMSPEGLFDTVTTTMGVGVLLTLFGIPAGFKSYTSARNVQTSFNEMVAAYEKGDTAAFESAKAKMKEALPKAMAALQEDYNDGTVDRAAELMAIDKNLSANLKEMKEGMRQSLELRQAREDGQYVAQSAIDFADARANQAITALKSAQGVTTAPASLYDQVATSTALTQMVNKDGLSSALIRGNGGKLLTENQLAVLQQIEQAAGDNPYVDMVYDGENTAEALQKDVDKQMRKVQEAQIQLNKINYTITAQRKAAKSQGSESVRLINQQIVSSGMIEQAASLMNTLDLEQQKLDDRMQQQAGYQTQAALRGAFESASVQAPVSPVQPQDIAQGQTDVDGEGAGVHTAANASGGAEQQAEEGGYEITPQTVRGFSQQAYDDRVNAPARRTEQLQRVFGKQYDKMREVSPEKADKATAALTDIYNKANNAPDETAANTAARMLFNKLEINRVVDELANDKFDVTKDVASEIIKSPLSKANSEKANNGGVLPSDYNAMPALRALNEGLSLIAKRQAHIQAATVELSALRIEAQASAKNKVLKKVNEATSDEQTKKAGVGDFFNEMSLRGNTFAAVMSGNKDNSAWDNLLYDKPSEALSTESWYLMCQSSRYQNFVENNELKPYLKSYKKPRYDYKTSGGTVIRLSQADIIMVYCNLRGNVPIGGFKFLNGHEVSVTAKAEPGLNEITYDDIANIASIVENPQGEQAQAVVQQIGEDAYARTKLVADFVYNAFNEDAYNTTIKYGKYEFEQNNVPGFKTMHEAAGQMRFGISRSRKNGYFPKQTLMETARSSASRTGIPHTSIDYTQSDTPAKILITDPMALVEQHGYEVAHELAYGEYAQELTRIMESGDFVDNNLLRVAEKTHGEKAKQWLKRYKEHTYKMRNADTNDLQGFARGLYNAVKTVKMTSVFAWLKQPTAAIYAAAYLNPKYAPKGGAFTSLTKAQKENIINKAPQLYMRSHGFGLKETTEAATAKGTSGKIQKIFSTPLVKFDIGTCSYLYKWCENQAKAEMPGESLEAVNKRTADLMIEVLNKSQATYAPHTTSMIGQEEGGMRYLTMFSTQTNSMQNTLVEASLNLKTPGKRGRGAKQILALILSMAAAAGMDKAREAMFPYQSDDDSAWNKITDNWVFETLSQASGLFYGARNIFSAMEYGASIPVLEEIIDVSDGLTETVNYFGKAAEAETEEDSAKYVHDAIGGIKKMAIGLFSLTGIPLKNIEKYAVKPAINLFGGQEAVTAYDNFFGYNTRAQDSYAGLSGALSSGDTTGARQYIKIIINKGGSLDKYLKAKTGGAELSSQQQYELTKLWQDVQLEMSLQDVAGGE